MKAARAPADAADRVEEFLYGQFDSSVLTVGMSLPKKWTPTDTPAVVVFDDSGPQQWPVSTTSTIRVTVWADGRTRARDLAGRCVGLLLSHRVPGLAHVGPGTGLIDDRDPDNDGFMASATVIAKIRTKSL